ncbi:MAG: hypothetical protein KAJ19_22130 [Gammaproteobacteria bacterium]|nr:hypothetical protein [Gammaproteobacteria bacterium]
MTLHTMAMDEVRKEWEHNYYKHRLAREKESGIRSSQISALIAYLIKIGVITEENVHP